MIGTVQEVDIGGNRAVRVGTYLLDAGDGTEPERRVFLAAGWASSPPLPFGAETVDLPEAALPELLEALHRVEDSSNAPGGGRGE